MIRSNGVRPLFRSRRWVGLAAGGLLTIALALGAVTARSATADRSTITVDGPPATWVGPALAGNPEPLGGAALVCSAQAGCDRTPIRLEAPDGFTDSQVISVTVTLTWSDTNSNFDVGLLDSNLDLLGQVFGISSGQSLTVDNVDPGGLIVEVDGDLAVNASYNGSIAATSRLRAGQQSQPAGALSFTPETVADPFRLGTEPSVTVGPHGTVYEAPILGFETTQSFVDRSDDGGATFNTVGVPGEGKLSGCAEGGDIAISTDNSDTLWFAGLTGGPTIPVGVSPDHGNTIIADCLASQRGSEYFADRPWLASDPKHGVELLFFRNGEGGLPWDPPPPVPSPWPYIEPFAGHRYGELIKTAPLHATGGGAGPQQLNFTSLCTSATGSDDSCFGNLTFAGAPATDTTSTHAGLTYLPISYGFTDSKGVGHGAVGVAVVDPTANPPFVLRPAAIDRGAVLFPSVAVDRAGNIYEVWNDPTTFQVMFAESSDQGQTWTPTTVVNGAPAAQAVMPAVVAGDSGRVDIAFYGSSGHAPPPANYGPWNVYLLQSLDAGAASPHWTQTRASDHTTHIDPVCLAGTACLLNNGPGGDRALGDFMQVTTDAGGRAIISFADGSNRLGDEAAGQRASEPSFDELVRQASGPSLYTSVGSVPPLEVAVNSISVAPHDNHIPYASPAGSGPSDAALELRGSSVTLNRGAAGGPQLQVHVTVANLDPVAATAPPALPVATYLTRWSFGGQVYFAAAELQGMQWRYFAGQAAPGNPGPLVKLAAYPASTAVNGSVTTGLNGTIDITVPSSVVGNPSAADTLYSVTSYALTHPAPTAQQVSGAPVAADDVPQIADALPAYNVEPSPSGNVAEFPAPALPALLLGATALAAAAVRTRRTGARRKAEEHHVVGR